MEIKTILIGYAQLPRGFVKYQFIKNALSIDELMFEKIVDSYTSMYGDMDTRKPENEIPNTNGVTMLEVCIMQCYLWLFRKHEGQELKLRFWMEQQGWDWRIKCELLQ